ncbi:MAG: undecaprenyl-diphosphatase UppP [Anaerolineales bacterium]|nr:undecaprenyl-diphosphatase UppP [Anaerolineales bacterium]
MTIFQAFILGIVQGLTEFLPVSSSGHLVLAPYWFGWEIPAEQAFIFDVLVQMGTLVAVFVYFWADVVGITRAIVLGLWQRKPLDDPYARLGWQVFVATVPAGLGGLLIKDVVAQVFESVGATAMFLFVTAGLLLVAERVGKRDRPVEAMTWADAVMIGFFQLLAVFPGVSRSGSTIAGGMTRNLERPAAGRFSFLMSIPIMLAAGAVSLVDLAGMPGVGAFLPQIAVGFVTAGVVGYLSIRWLLGYLAKRPLFVFAGYVTVMGGVTLLSLVW